MATVFFELLQMANFKNSKCKYLMAWRSPKEACLIFS